MAYMKDLAGRRLDSFEVASRAYTLTRVPVLARAMPPLAGGLSDGTKVGRLWMTRHKVLVDCHSLRVAFTNYYSDTAGGSLETPGPNAITIFVAASSGQPSVNASMRITPVGGTVIQPGQTVWLDVPIEAATGSEIYFVTQVAVSASQKWPNGIRIGLPNEGVRDTNAAPTTDLTMTTTTANLTYAVEFAYGPHAVTGIPAAGQVPSVMIIGDSIAYGVGGTRGEEGFVNMPLINGGIPHLQLGISGSTARAFLNAANRVLRMTLAGGVYFSHFIYEYATNDLGYTSAMSQNALDAWRILARRGMAGWAVTCVPHTADAGGLTPAPNESWRVTYNNWLRAGAPINATTMTAVAPGTSGATLAGSPGHPLRGYFEAADIVETSRNSGVWKSGTTSDGLHPNVAGHAALQACIDLSKFTV